MNRTSETPISGEPSPPGPAVSGSAAFVGRAAELAALLRAFEESLQGRGRLVLVSGEPGIGKSRLADELTAVARGRGGRVLWGRCWEAGGSPAYWPWMQSIRSYLRDVDPDVVRDELGAGASDIARMLPEVRDLFRELPEPPSVDPDTARFRLFEAVTALLKGAGQRQPLVVILDDLHAADTPSLLLLRFLGSELDGARILVMGAYRDTDLGPEHPLMRDVVELARLPGARRLSLSGMTEPDVAQLIELTTGQAASPEVVAAVHARTAGNPLFVGELARFLAAEGRLGSSGSAARAEVAVPAGVREVIGRRLGWLSEECVRILTLASVLGREFDLLQVERVTELSTDRLLDNLEEAAGARLILDVPGVLGRLRFSHALVRDALYEGIPGARRLRLHADVGALLEDLYRDDLEAHLSELAHHFVLAAPGGQVDRAVTYARRAGERAVRLLAYEEAVRLFEMAMEALELRRPVDQPTRCDLLLALGDAMARAGREADAKDAFVRAAELAGRLGAPHRLARAALGYGGRFVWARAGTDHRLISLLQRALAALGDEQSELRVRVMARLAGAMRDQPSREPRAALSEDALSMARRLGDPATLAFALDGRCAVLLWPENPKQRIGIADELERVAASIGDRERVIQARCYRTIALLELGDLPAVNVELGAAQPLAEELGQRSQIWLVTAMRATVALFQGRLAVGRRLMQEALSAGAGAQRSDAILSFRIHGFTLRRFQGGPEDVEAAVRRSVADYPGRPMFRCMLAVLHVEAGRQAEARAMLDELAEDGFAALPLSNEWLLSMSMLAEVVGALGDAARAATLYRLLVPYATRNGATADYISTGSVSRYLGILAAARGRWEEGERWFHQGLEANRRMGALPFVAWILHDLAGMLLARGDPGDAERSARLLAEGRDLAAALGMNPLRARIEERLQRAEPSAPTDGSRPATAAVAPRPNLFRREGDYWTIAYEGDAFRLRDLKGLRYLARLLDQPSREFHALDLVTMEGEGAASGHAGKTEPGLSVTGPTDAGPLLDAQAKQAYQRRLRDLEEEIGSARDHHDPERAARLEQEREFLIEELARAMGLGGRDRRAAAAAERARVSVTRAIRTAMLRIREHSQALGGHLDRTIRTGTFCSYQADPRAPADWRV
jgi:tetratricopeptide (TPR) repeat protein